MGRSQSTAARFEKRESMIKTAEIIGPSCLTNAHEDEPLFVLRANDELAPGVVRAWATQYLQTKSRQMNGATLAQNDKYSQAMSLAKQMEEWKRRQ